MSEISIRAEEIFHIGGFHVTNAVILGWVTLIVLVAAAVVLKMNLRVTSRMNVM